MTVWVSFDDGRSWPVSRLLHGGGASYSDLTIDRNGRVHVLFEVGTKKKVWGGAVMTARFPMSWLGESFGPPPPKPFSEYVYSVYRHVRGPLEEMWHAE